MAYIKAPIPSEVYHLTQQDKLDDILNDGKIRRFGDTECWFCESLEKMKAYMEQTVLCEGKAYYNVAEFLHGRVVRQRVQTASELWERLSEKIEQNWQTYQRALYERSPGVLIGTADEIAATATCYSEFLCSGSDLSRRDLSYLLQFENPLEVLRDRWVLDQSTEQGTRFLGMLESLRSEGHAEQDYPLDEAYAQIQKNEMSMQF